MGLYAALLSAVVQCQNGTDLVAAVPYHAFANPDLEAFALQLSPGLTADAEIYSRLDADVSKIKSVEPRVKEVRYRANQPDLSQLDIYFKDPRDLQRAANGDFPGWRCLNTLLGVRDSKTTRFGAIRLHFQGNYNPTLVKRLYESVPGIQSAEYDSVIGDGSNIFLTREGDIWVYVFDIAGGDCPSGCTEHELFLFEVTQHSRISRREVWKATANAEPPPEWVTTYFRRYQ